MEELRHITQEEIARYGVVAAPDVLRGKPADNKAVFDRLVRELVAAAVNEVIDRANVLIGTERVREVQEAGRVAAETGRVGAETGRVGAETGRVGAETARARAEGGRVGAEAGRAAAETGRVAAEGARAAGHTALSMWGVYSPQREYVPLNKVSHGGRSYVCLSACRGVAPGESDAHWLLAADRGADGHDGAVVNLQSGFFALRVSEDGRLILTTNAEGPTPPMRLDRESGHLFYTIG